MVIKSLKARAIRIVSGRFGSFDGGQRSCFDQRVYRSLLQNDMIGVCHFRDALQDEALHER
jgi:hypothetical protein